jgi:xylulokinase
MASTLRCVKPETVLSGADFSTGAVKFLTFDLDGRVLDEVRLPTDLWKGDPVDVAAARRDAAGPSRSAGPTGGLCELNLMQLEGQARSSVRAIAARLRDRGRLDDWAAAGISATHHTAGRIDADRVQVRRAICWNDHTLAAYHKKGLKRLGGQRKVQQLIGGPWAIRYSLSHLVKDEERLSEADWRRTYRILPHGPLAAGFLTGNFDVTSVSSAASTGIMDLRRRKWCRRMLEALGSEEHRKLAWKQLPQIIDHCQPVGLLADYLALEAGIDPQHRPLVFPTSDDQQAGLVGGGAVDDGQVAIVLGNSAVVNSSSDQPPVSGTLDVMRLNWGPYLWMRCYNNGAGLLLHVFGPNPKFDQLERAARGVTPGCGGTSVMPFVAPEPSRRVSKPAFQWLPEEPASAGVKFRACLEAIGYLIALGVREHEQAGQRITRITVSGGIARSDLMCEILATLLGRRLERLDSDEGPALGAAVTALAALETHLRRQQGDPESLTVSEAVSILVKFRRPVDPNEAWRAAYARSLKEFERRLRTVR